MIHPAPGILHAIGAHANTPVPRFPRRPHDAVPLVLISWLVVAIVAVWVGMRLA